MNRKWLIAAMVLPLLGGCSSENDAPEVVEQIPISLSNVSGDWTQTRGQLVESLDDFQSDEKGGGAFHVEGFKYMSADDTNPERVFTNQLVSWDKTNNEWTYSKLKFWDIAAQKYRFVGYFPANLIATSPSHLGTVDQNTLTLTNLPNWKWISVCDDSKLRIVPEEKTEEEINPDLEENPLCCENRNGEAMSNFYDAMVAYSQGTPQTYLSGENPGYVNLHFKHIYAMFVFKVAFPNIDVGGGSTMTKYVSHISIQANGIPAASTFDYKYNMGNATPTGTYYDYGSEKNIAKADDDVAYYANGIFAEGNQYLCTPVEALKEPHMIVRGLVVPFDLGTQVLNFKIKYYEAARGIKRDGKRNAFYTGGNLETPKTEGLITSAYIPVKDVNNQDLHKVEPGKVYTFTINFDTGIKLDVIDVAVSEWKEYSTPITQNFYNW